MEWMPTHGSYFMFMTAKKKDFAHHTEVKDSSNWVPSGSRKTLAFRRLKRDFGDGTFMSMKCS